MGKQRIAIRPKASAEYAELVETIYDPITKKTKPKFIKYLGKVIGYDEDKKPIIEDKQIVEKTSFYDLLVDGFLGEGEIGFLRMLLLGDIVKKADCKDSFIIPTKPEYFSVIKSQVGLGYYQLFMDRNNLVIIISNRRFEDKGVREIEISEKGRFPIPSNIVMLVKDIAKADFGSYRAYNFVDNESERNMIMYTVILNSLIGSIENKFRNKQDLLTLNLKQYAKSLVHMINCISGSLPTIVNQHLDFTVSILIHNGEILESDTSRFIGFSI